MNYINIWDVVIDVFEALDVKKCVIQYVGERPTNRFDSKQWEIYTIIYLNIEAWRSLSVPFFKQCLLILHNVFYDLRFITADFYPKCVNIATKL